MIFKLENGEDRRAHNFSKGMSFVTSDKICISFYVSKWCNKKNRTNIIQYILVNTVHLDNTNVKYV